MTDPVVVWSTSDRRDRELSDVAEWLGELWARLGLGDRSQLGRDLRIEAARSNLVAGMHGFGPLEVRGPVCAIKSFLEGSQVLKELREKHPMPDDKSTTGGERPLAASA